MSNTIQDASSTFLTLKPVCVNISFLLQQSKYDELITEFKKVQQIISKSSSQSIYVCFDYIAFPLLLLFEKDYQLRKQESIYRPKLRCIEEALETLCVLFDKVDRLPEGSKQGPVLKYLILFQSLFILHLKSEQELHVSSEELKSTLIKTFRVFLEKHCKDSKHLTDVTIRPILALFVSTLLDLSLDEKSKKLREEALECVNTIILIVHDFDVLSAFFPGTVSSLAKIITGDFKLGHLVISSAIRTLKNIALIVCSDEANKKALQKEEDSYSLEGLRELVQKKEKKVNTTTDKNAEWLATLREKFDLVLQRIFGANNYQKLRYEPRFELVKTASALLEKCPKTLYKSVPTMVECIMMAISDDRPGETSNEMRLFASNALSKFRNSLFQISNLSSLLSERFTALITALPRICTSENDDVKLAHLMLINSYIEMFGKNIQSILHTLLQQVSFSLMISLEIEDGPLISVVEAKPVINVITYSPIQENTKSSEEPYFEYPRKFFKLLSDAALKVVQQICMNLGYYGDLYMLMDHFRGILSEEKSARFHKQAIYIMNYLLRGAGRDIWKDQTKENNTDETIKLVKTHIDLLLDEYLQPKFWKTKMRTSLIEETIPNLKLTDTSKKSKDLLQIFDYIMIVSFMLESIGTFAMILRTHFSEYLIRTLYSVLEKLGDPYGIVSQSAHATLQMISYYCGYKNLTHLITENTDYIIDDICHRMKFLHLYPQTPHVVKALFELTKNVTSSQVNISLISLLEDTLESVFIGLDDHHMTEAHIEYLNAFFSILYNVVHVVVERKKRREKISPPPPKSSTEDDDEDDEKKPKTEADKEKHLVKQILKKCQHFLGIDDMSLRIKIIDIIDHSLDMFITADGSAQTEVYPLIHENWPQILSRWKNDKKKPVQLRAIQLIQKLMMCAGDFMYGRIVTEFYPTVERMLKELDFMEYIRLRNQHKYTPIRRTKLDDKQEDEQVFRYARTTPAYKLRLSILEFLCNLATCPSIAKRFSIAATCIKTYELCKLIYPYLDNRQPLEFQNTTMQLFKNLIKVDPDPVWLLLMEISNIRELKPQSSILPTIKIPMRRHENLEVLSNANKLIKYL